MAKSNKKSKKAIRSEVAFRMAATFADLQQKMGKKKFEQKVKKATKLLTAKVKTSSAKQQAPPLPPVAADPAAQS